MQVNGLVLLLTMIFWLGAIPSFSVRGRTPELAARYYRLVARPFAIPPSLTEIKRINNT